MRRGKGRPKAKVFKEEKKKLKKKKNEKMNDFDLALLPTFQQFYSNIRRVFVQIYLVLLNGYLIY